MKQTLLTFIIALLAATGAWAQTFTFDNLKYTVTDAATHTVELTGYETEPEGALTIPATVTNESTEYSVTSIGSSAFSWCSSLTEVNIPASVTNIGSWVFDYCKDKTTLVCYPIGKTETTYTVPATVTTFTTSAFENCTALAQINLPNSLTDMGIRTFYGCTSLTEVTLPDGVTQLTGFNFTDCSALEKVTLPEGITYIGSGAFKNCSALTELTVWAIRPPGVSNDAFTGVSSSLVVKVPAEGLPAYQTADIWKNFTLQGNGQAPFVVGNLKYRVTSQTENTVEVMGYQTAPTDALTIPATVTYNEVTYTVTGIKEQVFANCSALTSVSLPDGLTSIGNKTFEYCSALATVSIGSGLTTIGNAAFANCTSLTGITLPDGLTTIGDEAFFNCTSLTGITIPNTVTSIGIAAFRYSGLTTASIGNGVTTIGEEAFQDCSSLATVSIGSGLTTIGNSAFYACWALTQFNVDEANEAYCSDGGVLFNKDKTTLLQYPAGKTGTTYAVPASVTSIAKYAFAGSNALTEVTLPEGLTDIAEYAFAWCRKLTKISLPESLDNIGKLAFNECTALTENVFYNVNRNIPVYVPASAFTGYLTAEVWKEFNLQAISTTGLPAAVMPESIRIYNGTLHNPQQLHLTLYDMQGRQVYSGTAATVSQPAGVYVVRCNGASGKVLF